MDQNSKTASSRKVNQREIEKEQEIGKQILKCSNIQNNILNLVIILKRNTRNS